MPGAAQSRAVRFDHYGGTDVLYIADVAMPSAGPGEVVVQVKAAGINPGEAAIREGYLDAQFPATFPSGEGSDLAGIVTMVGDGTTGTDGVPDFAPGDEVLGWSWRRSSQADYVAVPVGQLVRKPAALSWPVAGSLYAVGVTSYAAVRAVAAGPGDTIAVSAAAGGVGSVVVQLLRIKGARVLGIASTPHHAWLESLGVTPVSYGDGLADRLRAAAPDGISAFIDLHGAEYVRLAVELGVPRDRIETIIAFDAAGEYGTRAAGSSDASTPEVLAEMAGLVASGQIDIPIAATYPLDEVERAYTELAKGHTSGKIVLIP
jgi:NADPH:quinone reductase